ncbi:hypothetical protein FRC02_005569 [Tulasnella sp. 418]|nr:hypothetical protein FRC02_005569 [Tulasnella sp. 418]
MSLVYSSNTFSLMRVFYATLNTKIIPSTQAIIVTPPLPPFIPSLNCDFPVQQMTTSLSQDSHDPLRRKYSQPNILDASRGGENRTAHDLDPKFQATSRTRPNPS